MEEEAQKLQKEEKDIIVEEDIIITASRKNGVDKTKKNKKVKKISKDSDLQWNMDAIHVSGNQQNKAKDKIKVAVLDSGVDVTEDIDVAERVNLVPGQEEVLEMYEDVSGHGTSIASIISAKKNDIGITGINSNVDLYSVKVLDENNTAPLSRIVEGIYWCIDNDVDIINMSFGTPKKSEILHKAIQDAENAGILLVAAAGNRGEIEGTSTVDYPAAFDEVVAVGAVNAKMEASEFSSMGEEVEVYAPGEQIIANGYFDGVMVTEGTSMAVPHVVGVASLLWGKDHSKSNEYIRAVLQQSLNYVDGEKIGVVDLQFADEIYGKNVYTSNERFESKIQENNSEVNSYEVDYVVGTWADGVHEKYVDGNLSTAKDVAGLTDKNFGSIKRLHGRHNYVANIEYLFNVAQQLNQGKSLSTALSNVKYIAGDKILYDTDTKRRPEADLDYVIKEACNNKFHGRNKAQVVLGLAIHLGGDIFAHKSSLPSVKKLDIKHFGQANYSRLEGLVKTRQISFTDLVGYQIKPYNEIGKTSYYEDNVNFYPSRLSGGTKYVVSKMCNAFLKDKDKTFQLKYLMAKLSGDVSYELKLQNLYYYAKELDASRALDYKPESVWLDVTSDVPKKAHPKSYQ